MFKKNFYLLLLFILTVFAVSSLLSLPINKTKLGYRSWAANDCKGLMRGSMHIAVRGIARRYSEVMMHIVIRMIVRPYSAIMMPIAKQMIARPFFETTTLIAKRETARLFSEVS